MKAFIVATVVSFILAACMDVSDPEAQYPNIASVSMQVTTGTIGPYAGEIIQVSGLVAGHGRVEMFFYNDTWDLVLTSATEIVGDNGPSNLASGFARSNQVTEGTIYHCVVQSVGVDGRVYDTRQYDFD